ncbi:murein L,D-transpeptidase catalytic domain family protein [Arenimonas alkanexedens]
MKRLLPTLLALVALPASAADGLLARLADQAPGLNPEVLSLALEASDCARQGALAPDAERLAVIDYSRPSTEPRLWVFDLGRRTLLFAEHVAHGRGSGDNLAQAFSNLEGSHQSSLGLFRTAETYQGGNGYSLRMDGLEPGVNDAARDRLIVMHGAPYVDPLQALRQGRLGRSFGCPALRPQVAKQVIDTLKQGQLLFAYFPDKQWLGGSRLLGCGRQSAARTAANAARRG